MSRLGDLIWLGLVALVIMDWVVHRRYGNAPWADGWLLISDGLTVIGCFAIACMSFADGKLFVAWFFAAIAAFGAWSWWHSDRHRRTRKRLWDKAAGIVSDMGGRLKVLRPSAESLATSGASIRNRR